MSQARGSLQHMNMKRSSGDCIPSFRVGIRWKLPDILGSMNLDCFKRGGDGIGLLTDVEAEYLFIASDAISSKHCGEVLYYDRHSI